VLFDKAHLGTDVKLGKPWLQHTVAVKIDFFTIGRFKKAIPLVGKELSDPTMWGGFVGFDITPILSHVIF
jgi:hypothetical protein